MTVNLGVKALLSWVSGGFSIIAVVFDSPNGTAEFMQVNSLKLCDQDLNVNDFQDGTVLLKVVYML